MNLGPQAGTKIVSCEKCGTSYLRSTERITIKDRDEFKCGCGLVLERWNTVQMPSFERI